MKQLLTFLFALLANFTFSQATYTVDNKPGAAADYDNLQTAIDDVPAGSTLLVQGSPNYYGSVTITKEIHIKGPGYFLDQNPNTQAYQVPATMRTININQGANGTSISGIQMANHYNIYINDCQYINISFCNIDGRHNSSYGIFITNSRNINVANSYKAYIHVTDNLSSNIILKNSIYSHIYGGNCSSFTIIGCIYPVLRSGMTAYNNIVWNSTYTPSGDPNVHHNIYRYPGTGTSTIDDNYNKSIFCSSGECDNLFINSDDPRYSADGQFILGAGSPASGAGVNGVDCGVFGGSYRLSGIPNIPNIYEFTVPNTGYTNDGGIPVNIKIKSNN